MKKFLSKTVGGFKYGTILKSVAIVTVVVLALYFLSCTCSALSKSTTSQFSRKEGFRFLRPPIEGTSPRAWLPAEMGTEGHQLPVGAKGAQAGATTTWFDSGGKVGGMDNVMPAAEMGFDRPDQLNIYSSAPAPANALMTGAAAPMLGPVADDIMPKDEQLLLPEETASLLDIDPTVSGPGQPILTSLSDRNQDLSGRAVDFPNARVPSDINDSEAPIPASASASAAAQIGATAEGFSRSRRGLGKPKRRYM